MGALNKQTNEYEYPAIASKSNCYKCPDCDRDVTFKKGEINRPHFAHKQNDACDYYDRPNETQIHKDAKNLLYTLLKNKTELNIKRKCVRCNGIYHVDGEWKGHTISHYNYEDGSPTPMIEYPFKYNNSNKRADVALVYDIFDSHCETHIFEICHTHATKECDRPDPWFEFNALSLINDINNQIHYRFSIDLFCLRQPKDNNKCPTCIQQQQNFEQEQLMKQLRRIEKDEKKKKEDEKKEEEARLRQIERQKEYEEANRLYKLRQEEEQRKKLEQQQEQQKQRESAYEAEKLNRESIIERIRRKHPNILRIKGT
jgi:hypothetical protein